jgi:DNA-binding Lrp family transcriptional regulator
MEITRRLLELTQEHSGIDVTAKGRRRDLVESRALYFHIFKEIKPSVTLQYIGGTVGLDYTTVIHALRQYEIYEKYNTELKYIKEIIIKKYREETVVDEYIYAMTADLNKLLIKYKGTQEGDILTNRLKEFIKTNTPESGWYEEALEQRMNIVGQNGNDGEHYN